MLNRWLSTQGLDWLASVAVQAGLCLAWSEIPKDTFCRVVAHILIKSNRNLILHCKVLLTGKLYNQK